MAVASLRGAGGLAWRLGGVARGPLKRRAFAAAANPSNRYINLGKFETMGLDLGRAATGLAYLQETLEVQQKEYEAETLPFRKSAIGVSLAKSLHEVGRQNHQLGDAETAIGQYQNALQLLSEAIDFREKDAKLTKALIHTRFVKSEVCSSLGVAYFDLGQPETALAHHQEALQLRKDLVGRDHPSVAECLNNLGSLHYARGAFEKAAENFEEALELLPSQETPYVALALYNLGLCRAHQGQPAAAGSALKRALKIAERSLGPSHPQTDLIRSTLRGADAQKAPPGDVGPAGSVPETGEVGGSKP
ncbi:unnamed protein product [Cladocopium goreaui]|uniref:Kinesin light chain n=1 Tax=Cladocopium goreaui TaxID=2562237 RepID=A0A9P1DSB4_9DINO|nr:unnamed protein product [Cladocopium goreaui]